MFVRVMFIIPEEGEITLTSEISAVIDYPSGARTFQFTNPVDFYGVEGRERFLGIEIDENRKSKLIEESGSYSLSFISFSEEFPLPSKNKIPVEKLMRSPA